MRPRRANRSHREITSTTCSLTYWPTVRLATATISMTGNFSNTGTRSGTLVGKSATISYYGNSRQYCAGMTANSSHGTGKCCAQW
ncbi:unnamed protein product [Medioppia subpectinata]|uniref:Uncharacterized protein n=1 Tax=Medioppia subpectinata TaxID=1979941 RepID=A0A7R9LTZ4_9ACAR|nr:unnamed protein product [Medioppia subpectinata]CAG2121411.1 unnamed protein product [Medioppia subpectinata]